MALSDAQREALSTLRERSVGADVAWVLTASGNLALRGVDVDPNDLDVMTDVAGARRIADLFANDVVRDFRRSEAPEHRIRSFFGALDLGGVEVEVMGDVEHLVNGEWTPTPDVAEVREFAAFEGDAVPAMPLERELEGYRELGREERVRQVEAFLARQE